jgi:hypothetical protein
VAYQLALEPRASYLHFTVTGENSRETVTAYMEEVVRECVARGCSRVLIEERLIGPRLGTVDVFQMVSAGSARFRGVLSAMAFVDVNAEDDLMRFAEDVAVNRGMPVRVFRAVADATQWLTANERASADPATRSPP